jgi:signal transduction histidine kinase
VFPKSLRWRLPISYAAIALLATLVLGLVLLTILRSYYQQRELDYLYGNARAIGLELGSLLNQDSQALEVLEGRLTSLSFLSQAQVRLLDLEGNILADSGSPENRQDMIDLSLGVSFETEINAQESGDGVEKRITKSAIILRREAEEGTPAGDGYLTRKIVISTTERSNAGLPDLPFESMIAEDEDVLLFSAIGTPYGFGLSTEPVSAGRRSDQVVRYQITDLMGRPSGYLELSNGPAYGQDILASVAWGWAIASAIAVLLAAAAGWLISRRLSSPLLKLTEATIHMAEGDLSVRAAVNRQDEVGQLAYAFNRMARQVEETVAALRRFVADAAHELHTPLTALTTNLELAAGEADPALYIERAWQQAARLEALTTDLLALSRLESGVEEHDLTTVNLTGLVQEAGERYASQAEQAGLSFRLALPDSALSILGQQTQLQRALGNLLDNALKFTPSGGEVALSLYQEERMAVVSVQDTGIGIPTDALPQLFNRFHRGRNTAGYPGSGLGLAIVQAIVDRHAGRVTVESGEAGTQFLIELPLAPFR